MKSNGFDPNTPDFIWNKNRLAMEKEAIKRQMLNVINKKTVKKASNASNWEAEKQNDDLNV